MTVQQLQYLFVIVDQMTNCQLHEIASMDQRLCVDFMDRAIIATARGEAERRAK